MLSVFKPPSFDISPPVRPKERGKSKPTYISLVGYTHNPNWEEQLYGEDPTLKDDDNDSGRLDFICKATPILIICDKRRTDPEIGRITYDDAICVYADKDGEVLIRTEYLMITHFTDEVCKTTGPGKWTDMDGLTTRPLYLKLPLSRSSLQRQGVDPTFQAFPTEGIDSIVGTLLRCQRYKILKQPEIDADWYRKAVHTQLFPAADFDDFL